MPRTVIIQEFGKNKQIMVTIPSKIAQLLGFSKGKIATWEQDDEGAINLKLEAEE